MKSTDAVLSFNQSSGFPNRLCHSASINVKRACGCLLLCFLLDCLFLFPDAPSSGIRITELLSMLQKTSVPCFLLSSQP